MDYSNFKIDMPNDVDFIINTIKSHGHQAYAVGGCVRDSIMGLTPNDWDITTSALPSDIKEYFNKLCCTMLDMRLQPTELTASTKTADTHLLLNSPTG
mgnify:CR=1 FL=1